MKRINVFFVVAVLALLAPGLAVADDCTSATDCVTNKPVTTQNITTPETIRNVPSVSGPAVQTTAPCIVGVSGSVNVVGFGAGFGKGIEDVKCTEREETRINTELLLRTADKNAALAYLCMNSSKVAAALGDKCPTKAVAPAPVKTGVAPGEYDPFVCRRTGDRCPPKE